MAGRGRKPGKKAGANGYKLPDPITAGEVLTDLGKKQWLLGKSIGIGGFGEIYSAAPFTGKPPKDYPLVIKIEPHGNGPLFVEMHFYMRNAKSEDIELWKKKKHLSSLGMPKFIANGSHEYKGTKYRFVVMERYGTDLWKLFLENNRHFSEATVYRLGIQIIDVLEYIHSKTYVHADIKGANLLLDLKNENQVYLVDFGLASHYTTKNEYKVDPKKAHNGTIEYTSRDAHMGIPTRRGDFEILGYNLIQWLCGSLPWEKDLKNPASVQKMKEKAFDDIEAFLDECFKGKIPTPINDFMDLLAEIEFNDTPNYDEFKDIFVGGLKKLGQKVEGKLDFSGISDKKKKPEGTPKKVKKTEERGRKADETSKRVKKADEVTPKRVKKTDEVTPKRVKKADETPKRGKKADVTPKRVKKVETPRKMTPRAPLPPPAPHSLDESCIGVLVDSRREKLKDMKKILESIDDDSDTEYGIVITKKRKAKKSTEEEEEEREEEEVPKKAVKRGKKKVLYYEDSGSEDEVIPKGTKTRQPTKRAPRKKRNDDSDVDMFDD